MNLPIDFFYEKLIITLKNSFKKMSGGKYMGTKIQYKIGVLYLFLFLIFTAISIKPISQPVGDGAEYSKIAENYKLFVQGKLDNLPNYLYRDRLLPATTAGIFADIFNIPVSVSFYILSYIAMFLFYFFTWHFLSKKATNLVALTGLWICYTINSYPITWNLFNVYQLTDCMIYLWTALITIAFVEKKLFLFIPISFLSIITKQNLWFLVLPGYLFFTMYYFNVKENKKLVLSLIFGSIITSIVLFMYFTEAASIQNYMAYCLGGMFDINLYKGRWLGIFKEFFWVYLPVLPVIFIKYKTVLKKTWEYFPFVPFFAASFVVVWPISLLEASMDAYVRIMQPIVWPLCAYIVVLIVNDFDKMKNKCFLGVLSLAPIFFGVAHLVFFTISFKPLFVLPAVFRHCLALFLIAAYVLIWYQTKVRKLDLSK